jgi:hypothetical protein
MRILNSNELNKVKTLTGYSVELTFLEPTQTGLEKSILDATAQVRTYLKERNIHDYQLQKQGVDCKVVIPAFLVQATELLLSKASLYRPETKKGDPRIWFSGLKEYTKANDIIGITYFDNKFYVINVSSLDINELVISPKSNPLYELITEIRAKSNEVANELLYLLKRIARNGPVPAVINADTGIGRTVEHLLGIPINSSKKPDFKGIELKSFRDEKRNRKNLFAQVPNWELSKFKSSAEILNAFGYERGDDFKLYCTVSSVKPNSQGLMLRIDNNLNSVVESSNSNIGDFVLWSLPTLHSRLIEKHNETFWISADSHYNDGREYFVFKKVEHTKKPIVAQFDVLIEQGLITVDHLIKHTPSGKVVEKGPLFKIVPSAISLLFPPGRLYSLKVH